MVGLELRVRVLTTICVSYDALLSDERATNYA